MLLLLDLVVAYGSHKLKFMSIIIQLMIEIAAIVYSLKLRLCYYTEQNLKHVLIVNYEILDCLIEFDLFVDINRRQGLSI